MAMKARYTVLNGEVLSQTRNGVRHHYVPDPSGNVVALFNSTGTKTDTFGYRPYGEEQSRTGTTETPFRFGGAFGYNRDSARSTYVRARHYRSDHGRWQTHDPAGISRAEPNPFRYAYNTPINLVDPSGMLAAKIGQAGTSPPCDFGKYSPPTEACAQNCLQKDGSWNQIMSCMRSCLKKGTPKWLWELVCYIYACANNDGKDACKNPDAAKYTTDCMDCATFNLRQCLCKNAGLQMGVKCQPKYDKDRRNCVNNCESG